ncbi:shikimate kinase [Paraliobacillus sp. JSM ZJ581]|uniref:shikimate kinase n=1 Tax=Paraliobacillus sp. JSM ZJ581 TaxID=3342118 RepID=UPI0035A845B4
MKSIYLIGFMGSGKTTVAKLLAQKLELAVQDTDQMVENYYQLPIKKVFANYGEEVFRKYEHHMLTKTNQNNTIIATGGGIIELSANIEWLSNKEVIYLKTSWAEIVNRLKFDRNRPIWNDQSRDKENLLTRRDSKYKQASKHVVYTDDKDTNEIAEEIITLIKEVG